MSDQKTGGAWTSKAATNTTQRLGAHVVAQNLKQLGMILHLTNVMVSFPCLSQLRGNDLYHHQYLVEITPGLTRDNLSLGLHVVPFC